MVKPRVNGRRCEECSRWEARYDALLAEVLAMKREGFAPPPRAEDFVPPPPLDAVIVEALRDFGLGSATYRQQEKLAWDLKRSGEAPEMIAAKIAAGEDIPL